MSGKLSGKFFLKRNSVKKKSLFGRSATLSNKLTKRTFLDFAKMLTNFRSMPITVKYSCVKYPAALKLLVRQVLIKINRKMVFNTGILAPEIQKNAKIWDMENFRRREVLDKLQMDISCKSPWRNITFVCLFVRFISLTVFRV